MIASAQNPEDQDDVRFTGDQRRILMVTMIPLLMSLLSVSIVNVVLPSVEASIGAGSSELQWVLSGYALAFGVILVAAGRAGDVFGPGRLFLFGITLFTLGALGSGLAPGAMFLNLARVVMGLGSGLLNPQVIALMQQFFSGTRRGRAFGVFGGVVGVSVAIGPVLGGVLIAVLGEDLGWRAAFLVNVPIGVLALLAARFWLPDAAWRPVSNDQGTGAQAGGEPSSEGALSAGASDASSAQTRKAAGARPRADLDPVGTLLFGLGILLVMLPFVERSAGAWVWALIPAGLLVLGGWLLWERRVRTRGREPMVDLDIFRTTSFANGTLLISVYFLGMTSLWVVMALYLQQGLGYSALAAGFIGLPNAVLNAVTAPIAGRWITKVGRPMVLWGVGIVLCSLAASMLVVHLHQSAGASIWWLLLSLAPTGIGQAMVVSPNQTLALVDVPVRHAGSAGGVLQTGQRVGQSVGMAAITGVVFASVARGGWDHAVTTGLLVIAVVVVVAGLVGVKDQVQGVRGTKKVAVESGPSQ